MRHAVDRPPMARTRHAGEEALDQLPDDVGRVAQLERPPACCSLTLQQHVHDQRKGESRPRKSLPG